MRKAQVNEKDNCSDLYIIYENISFKESCKYLGTLKRIGKYLGAEPFGEVTKLKFEKGVYFYDDRRRLLLRYPKTNER